MGSIPGSGPGGSAGRPAVSDQPSQVLSPLTTAGSHLDPVPHAVMAGACGAGAWWAYARMANPRAAGIVGAAGLAYAYAADQLRRGNAQMGYDAATLASAGLLAATGRQVYAAATPDAWATSLAALAGVSLLGNVAKAYQQRTGRPQDLDMDSAAQSVRAATTR